MFFEKRTAPSHNNSSNNGVSNNVGPSEGAIDQETIKITSERGEQAEKEDVVEAEDEVVGEPGYCICNGVSYGVMIGCDGEDCTREWFHLRCVGLTHPPKRNGRVSLSHAALKKNSMLTVLYRKMVL